MRKPRALWHRTHLFVLPAIVKALAVIPPINHNKLLQKDLRKILA